MTSITILPSHHRCIATGPSRARTYQCDPVPRAPPISPPATRIQSQNHDRLGPTVPFFVIHALPGLHGRQHRVPRASGSRGKSRAKVDQAGARIIQDDEPGRGVVQRCGGAVRDMRMGARRMRCGELHERRRSVGPHRQTKTPKAQSVRPFIIRITEAPTTDNAHPATRQFRFQVHARQSTSRGEVSANRSSRERTDRRVASKPKQAGAHCRIFALECIELVRSIQIAWHGTAQKSRRWISRCDIDR